jgi:hypothetical protein
MNFLKFTLIVRIHGHITLTLQYLGINGSFLQPGSCTSRKNWRQVILCWWRLALQIKQGPLERNILSTCLQQATKPCWYYKGGSL